MSIPAEGLSIGLGDFVIRPYRQDDRERIVRHANNRRVARTMRDRFPHPYTDEDANRWLSMVEAQSQDMHLAIANPQELVGGIGFTLQEDVHCQSAEIGYWLGESYWRRGIATAAVRTLSRYALIQLDLLCVFAGVFSNNLASMRVLEKAGFRREGVLRKRAVKDGQVLDLAMYSLTHDDLTGN